MKKVRFLLGFGAICLAAMASAQNQSDITIPPPNTLTSSFGMIQVVDTYIDGTSIHVVYVTRTVTEVPDMIPIEPFQSRGSASVLMASVAPVSAGRAKMSEEEELYKNVVTSVSAVNERLRLIHKGKVGLDVYNELVAWNKKAFKASLGLVRYLKGKSSPDSSDVADLSSLVDKLEGVNVYVTSIRGILSKV